MCVTDNSVLRCMNISKVCNVVIELSFSLKLLNSTVFQRLITRVVVLFSFSVLNFLTDQILYNEVLNNKC